MTESLEIGVLGAVTRIVVFGSAMENGSGCVNLDTVAVGGLPAKSIDATSLRFSADQPLTCPGTGGAPIHDLGDPARYQAHLVDKQNDGAKDLIVHADTAGIGGDASTFGADDARVCIITHDGAEWLDNEHKRIVARRIWNRAVEESTR